jgi:hypothetical protein
MTLGYPRTFDGVVRPLTTTLQSYKWFASRDSLWWGYVHYQYNSISPDTLFIAGIFDGTLGTIEPPNITRKALLEIKFDTVKTAFGTLEFDTTSRYIHSQTTLFVSRRGIEMRVNFKKGIITVANSGSCEDMNGDGDLTIVDIVQALNCASLKESKCARTWAMSDVTVLLRRLFYDGSMQPLIPPAPCE